MSANDRQVGGSHYRKVEGEQHWDRQWRKRMDPFQYQISKYLERWRDKNGLQDVEKGFHFYEKYLELLRTGNDPYALDGSGQTKGWKPVVEEVPEIKIDLNDPGEAAFWEFDARRKGYGQWKQTPQSERDAFKAVFPYGNWPGSTEPKTAEAVAVEKVFEAKIESASNDVIDTITIVTEGQIMPTGWVGFVFEGCNRDVQYFRCRRCKGHFSIKHMENPYVVHHRMTEELVQKGDLAQPCESIRVGPDADWRGTSFLKDEPQDGEPCKAYTGQD